MKMKLKYTYIEGVRGKAGELLKTIEHKCGSVLELAEDEAKRLLGLGHATEVKEETPSKKADAPPPK